MNTIYLFIVDTDQYAGNFEREMCAYMTGAVGECGVGEEYAKMFNEEEPDTIFDNNMLFLDEDDYSCRRPVKIVSTDEKLWVPNSIGMYFEDWLLPEEIDILKKRAQKFVEFYKDTANGRVINILGFRKLTRVTKETLETI